MTALDLLALLIYTFGAYAYGAILFLSIRDLGTRAWAGRVRSGAAAAPELAGGVLLGLGFLWFVANLVTTVVHLGPPVTDWPFQMVTLWLAFLWPPLIMHVMVAERGAAGAGAATGRVWRLLLWPAYLVMLGIPLVATLAFAGVLALPEQTVNVMLNGGLAAGFVAASAFSVAISARHPRPGATPRERVGERATNLLFAVTVLLFLLLPAIAFSMNPSVGAVAGRSVEIAARSLPLAFLFVGAYFESRFEFFDILLKRGLSLFATIAALALFFAASGPLLRRFQGGASAWVSAVVLLPVVLALPWLHARIAAVLDRWWLGRRYTTVAAVKHFIGTLRSATTEAELVARAEQALGEIFGAPAAVRLDPAAVSPGFPVLHDVLFVTPAGVEGALLMGPRTSEAPYFSEDVTLLASLADVFASVLDNLHLQARKQEHEQQAQALSLHASRSELKALRAQINPHFLFNALNAIAGLIHRNPARADRTIEQLADVFRYALRGAESEWAVLDNEVEFVGAYLEVERARFGDRLRIELAVDESARGARVPTMIVQTLVENAVKHGLSELRGPALVRVDARAEHQRLTIAVADNGPGFSDKSRAVVQDEPAASGYGLANIRKRLDGYFGADGALAIDRDEPRGLTVVSVTMPLVRDAFPDPQGPSAVARREVLT